MDYLFEDSTAMHFGEIIDCRYLSLYCEFYDLSNDEVIGLTEDTIKWLQNIFTDEVVSSWRLNERNCSKKRILEKSLNAVKEGESIIASVEAFMRSPIIRNNISVGKLRAEIQKYPFRTSHLLSDLSMDYKGYWQDLFPEGRCSDEEVICRIRRLMNEKERYPKTICYPFDAHGILSTSRYAKNPTKFYGSFNIGFSAFCLGSQLIHMSEILKSYMIHLSEKYCKCNARVMLQPLRLTSHGSPYRDLFGQYLYADGSHIEMNQSKREWYTTYYLHGVEWANIISPKAKVHINSVLPIAFKMENIQCRELYGGGIFLQSLKPIDLYDVDDALILKSIVSDALYPGTSNYPLRDVFSSLEQGFTSMLPRSDWPIIPVFDDEIVLIGKSLVFRARNVLKENHHYIQ